VKVCKKINKFKKMGKNTKKYKKYAIEFRTYAPTGKRESI
jgi:hypothetical protein